MPPVSSHIRSGFSLSGHDGRRPGTRVPTDAVARRLFPTVSDEELAALAQFQDEARREIRAPTLFENPGYHFLLQIYAARIDEQVARYGRWPGLSNPPVFGLISLGQVNARTIRVPHNNDYLVLVDEELFTFLYLFAKAVALAMPAAPTRVGGGDWRPSSTPIDFIREHLRSTPEAVYRFGDVVLAFAMTGRASAAEPHTVSPERQELATALCEASELFVIAHEYTHVLEGHLKRALPYNVSENNDVVVQSLLSVADEGIADAIGLDLTYRALNLGGHHDHFARWGFELFAYANEILMKSIGILRAGTEQGMHSGESHQHASFDFRRLAVDMRDTSTAGRVMRLVLTELWNMTRPAIVASHRRGARPSQTWEA